MTGSEGRRAVVLGGTGAIGGATALRLAEAGWQVDVTGRHEQAMPQALVERGVRFHAVDRRRTESITRLIGSGADLVVDVLAYQAHDIESLTTTLGSVASVVVISGRAVYRDHEGRHVNSDEPPRFSGPVGEQNAVLDALADGDDPFTARGYGPGKVGVEKACRASGLPITVLRPSKVHGPWGRQPRSASLIEALLAGGQVRFSGGDSINHLSAAGDIAALIEIVADKPDRRVLNVADRTPVTARQLVLAVADRLGRRAQVTEFDDEPTLLGATPWYSARPFVLDTTAAQALGHRPRSTLDLLTAEIDWLVEGR